MNAQRWKATALASVAAAVGLGGCGGGDDRPDAQGGDSTQVTVASSAQIAILDLASGEVTPLTSGETASAGGPAWSPDGRRIAFSRRDCDVCPSRAVVSDLGSGAETDVVGSKGGDEPAWSPDGRSLVLVRTTGNKRELVLVGLDSSRAEVLELEGDEGEEGEADGAESEEESGEDPGRDEHVEVEHPSHPGFSPAGASIAFDAETDGEQMRVFLLEPASAGVELLDVGGRGTAYPAYAQDGTIAFSRSGESGDWDLCIAVPGAGAPACLTEGAANDVDPAWMPDGTAIVFASDSADPLRVVRSLYLVNRDGSNPRRLTSGFDAGAPAVSPDGSSIAFVRRELLAVASPSG